MTKNLKLTKKKAELLREGNLIPTRDGPKKIIKIFGNSYYDFAFVLETQEKRIVGYTDLVDVLVRG